jgi:single-stranded-DNA-specific exonuclease
MEKRWLYVHAGEHQEVMEKGRALAAQLNIPELLGKMLVRRGVDTFEKAREFFRPDLNSLHDPFLMKDMDKAVDRLVQAIENHESILVYGDYDVDGTTAVALVYQFLSSFTSNISFYIPDRYTEGYGISFAGIDFAYDNDIDLIIALDCGIKSIDKVNYAKEKGIDFIICDHHRPGDTLPEAVAVLDPKREDCRYPFDELCGCGVGFKFMQAFCIREGIDLQRLLPYLDLVAIAIAADIVPVTGENRVLSYFGLQRINTQPSMGIAAILRVAGKSLPVDVSNLVFIIAPRINAAGRIKSGRHAVELLIAATEEEATDRAFFLNEQNDDRKSYDREITQQALEMIASDDALRNAKTTVLFHDDWHKGVIGIVASRLTETYYRPTILFSRNKEKLTGSARSVKDYDVYEAIEACSHLLEQFGGHKYAAGLTLPFDQFEAFRKAFETYVASTITEELLRPAIEIEEELHLYELKLNPGESLPKFYRILKQFSPFGPGNMAPVFVARNLSDQNTVRLLKEEHLKLRVKQGNSDFIDAIAFNQARHFNAIANGASFDLAFTIEENEWNGKVNLQLMVKDIVVHD